MPDYAAARDLVATSKSVVFFTGAGLGADSGIPTFRGRDGLWEGFRAEELASPEGFAANPEKVWEWYRWRRRVIAEAQPHDGHVAISEHQQSQGSAIVTQNVDGFHQRTGAHAVHELHGSIWRTRCNDCLREHEDLTTDGDPLPRCPCGGPLRPAVVWFGEGLPSEPWEHAQSALEESDLVVVVGTSAVVQPAASLVGVAVRAGAQVIEVNPEPVMDGVGVSVAAGAREALPRILSASR